MADPYYRYVSADKGDPRSAFPGYLHPDGPAAAPHSLLSAAPPRLTPELLPNNSVRPGAYNFDEIASIGGRSTTPGLGVLPVAGDIPGFGHTEDPLKRREPSLSGNESNVLFVDNLPVDCTRREVGHLFRPFIGFKDIKLVHKEPRRTGDKSRVLCFVEFTDIKCAVTALDALQGYKFDEKKPDAPVLRIQFAHFPFRLPL